MLYDVIVLGGGPGGYVAAERAGAFDRIVCSGGDGTLHEVVTGLMTQETRPAVGYIPAGTTNDFAKNLSLPRGMEAMARAAAYVQGRDYVVPADVRLVYRETVAHRLLLTPETESAGASAAAVLDELLKGTMAPRTA